MIKLIKSFGSFFLASKSAIKVGMTIDLLFFLFTIRVLINVFILATQQIISINPKLISNFPVDQHVLVISLAGFVISSPYLYVYIMAFLRRSKYHGGK